MASSSHRVQDSEVPFGLPDGRDFLRSRINALNVEKHKERFSVKSGMVPPPIATWRSNLAASSQRRNILFVAYGCDVYVWIPRGPFQQLGSQAEMVIRPVMRNPHASGYIDRTTPHAINSLLVDDLGRDEVLLVATDSGNVCGYQVEAIYSAICRCAKSDYQRPYNGAEMSPFFVENVGMSAWGLATHKFARLIAVSANTGQVTVFAFALVDPRSVSKDGLKSSTDASNTDKLDQTWMYIDSRKQLRELQKLMPCNHRSRNLRITYRGHFDNIPCVSFANFDLDANGTWMVSTDISNRIVVWRIWDDLWPARSYYPGHPMNNPPQRGWTVLPLDPRTFKHHLSKHDACGCEPEPTIIEHRIVLDVSKAIEDVPDASQLFVFGHPKERVTPKGNIVSNGLLPDDIASPECISSGLAPGVATIQGQQTALQVSHTSHVDDKGEFESETQQYRPEPNLLNEGNHIASRKLIRTKRPLRSLFEEDDEHYQVISRLHHEYSFEMAPETSLEVLKHRPVHPRRPSFFPVIHFSEHNISLTPYPLDSEYQILSKNSLFQRYAFNQDIHSACDRFNMVKYIPELGLVAAASQKGRVAIIALTWQQEIGYTFRLDWIVPFWSQERDDGRPMVPLLGLAVSPMPGFETPPDAPYIPRGVDPDDWLTFNYRILNLDEDEMPLSPSASGSPISDQHIPYNPATDSSIRSNPHRSNNEADSASESDQKSLLGGSSSKPKSPQCERQHTAAELHAQASSAYHPHEHWHGWHPSRHYRLLLLYCDHTVMSYEFWHDWKV